MFLLRAEAHQGDRDWLLVSCMMCITVNGCGRQQRKRAVVGGAKNFWVCNCLRGTSALSLPTFDRIHTGNARGSVQSKQLLSRPGYLKKNKESVRLPKRCCKPTRDSGVKASPATGAGRGDRNKSLLMGSGIFRLRRNEKSGPVWRDGILFLAK